MPENIDACSCDSRDCCDSRETLKYGTFGREKLGFRGMSRRIWKLCVASLLIILCFPVLYIYIYYNSVLHKRWSVVGSQQQQRSPIFVDWAISRRFDYNKRPAISLPLYSLRTPPSAITRQGLNNQTLKLYFNLWEGT